MNVFSAFWILLKDFFRNPRSLFFLFVIGFMAWVSARWTFPGEPVSPFHFAPREPLDYNVLPLVMAMTIFSLFATSEIPLKVKKSKFITNADFIGIYKASPATLYRARTLVYYLFISAVFICAIAFARHRPEIQISYADYSEEAQHPHYSAGFLNNFKASHEIADPEFKQIGKKDIILPSGKIYLTACNLGILFLVFLFAQWLLVAPRAASSWTCYGWFLAGLVAASLPMLFNRHDGLLVVWMVQNAAWLTGGLVALAAIVQFDCERRFVKMFSLSHDDAGEPVNL